MSAGSISAYVLAADPWWLRASVASYYAFVDRIVVSYDQDHRSWTGTELPVEECLAVLRSLDVDGKCEYVPGHFARPAFDPLENDTHQRQCALDLAAQGARWVLQLDTDEVLQRPDVFLDCLSEADGRAATALEFPARWLYAAVRSPRIGRRGASGVGEGGEGWFLERCRRFWGISGTFPGPVAVRAGTALTLARQTSAAPFRVDYRATNTDMWHPPGAPVHRVIGDDDGMLHFSWVRDLEYMRRKTGWSGHRDEYSEPRRLRHWRRRSATPLRTTVSAPLHGVEHRFRLVRLPVRDYLGERERELLATAG